MEYNYYGNYEKENITTPFHVHDIHKKQKEKESMRLKIYSYITGKCFKRIKEVADNEQTYTFYQLPEYIPGYPLYNMTECVMYVLEILHEKGFHARYVDHFILYISWNLPKSQFKMIQNKEEPPKKNIIENLPLKYKPIETYEPFTTLFTKKK
jgi:hypothetical protein